MSNHHNWISEKDTHSFYVFGTYIKWKCRYKWLAEVMGYHICTFIFKKIIQAMSGVSIGVERN